MDSRQLEEQAVAALRKTGYYQLANIQVDVADDEDETLTLRGEVSSFYMKQMAQEKTRINGCRVVNLIKVSVTKASQ
jgi:hypothetical protein